MARVTGWPPPTAASSTTATPVTTGHWPDDDGEGVVAGRRCRPGRRVIRDNYQVESESRLVVTLVMPPDSLADPEAVDETPLVPTHGLGGPGRAFRVLLATSGAIVLLVLVSILTFLAYHSWW